jgi:HEAT repeat protein
MKCCFRILLSILILTGLSQQDCFSQTLLTREKIPEIPEDINPEIKRFIEMIYTEKWGGGLHMLVCYREIAGPAVPFAIDRLRDVNPKWKKSYFNFFSPTPGRDIAEKIAQIGAYAIPALLKGLHDEDPYVRAGVAYTLYLIHSNLPNLPSVASEVIPLLKDEDAQVRHHAVYALGAMKDEIAIYPLIESLSDKSVSRESNVQQAAVTALGNYGVKATNPLLESVDNKDAPFRENVAKALGKGGDQESVGFLCSLLEDDSVGVKAAAASALGSLRNPQAVEPLLLALEKDDEAVCACSALALGKIGDKRAVEPLLSILKETTASGRLRWSIASALGEIGDNIAVPALIESLRDRDSRMRRQSATALGKIRDKRAVDALLELLGDEDIITRTEASEALCNIGDPKAIGPVIKNLEDGHMWKTAKFVVQFGEQAVEPLIELLHIGNTNARERAAWILGEIKDRRAVEPLILALNDGSENLKRTAIESLGKHGDVKAVGPLIAIFGSGNLGLQTNAVDALVNIGAGATQLLVESVHSNNPDVRKYSARTLGKLRNPHVVEALIELIDDENQEVRNEVVRALSSITQTRYQDKAAWKKAWPELRENCFKRWEDSLKR